MQKLTCFSFPPFNRLDLVLNKLRSAQICDSFLRWCRHHGVTQLYIVLLEQPVGGYFKFSADEVLRFCEAPPDDTRKAGRVFYIDYVANSRRIAESVIKVSLLRILGLSL